MSLSAFAKIIHPLPRVVRFLTVGLINTGFSYLIYAIGLFVGLPFTFANLIACLIGIFFSFRTQGAWVFKDAHDPKFLRFVLVWISIYLVNIGLIALILDFGLDAYWAGAIALPFIVVLSYFAQRFFVFRPAKP